MDKTNEKKRYNLDVLKLIRNNNVIIQNIAKATKKTDDETENRHTYFMLDYFDLMFHQKLHDRQKIYKNFWDFESAGLTETTDYKVAYKTLSLYEKESADIPENEHNAVNDDRIWTSFAGKGQLSITPFIGVIQINIIYHKSENMPAVNKTLQKYEEQIKNRLNEFISKKAKGQLLYRVFRSSTSGDFCLIIRSACVEDIYEIATTLNNNSQDSTNGKDVFEFETYTNVGIECIPTEDLAFSEGPPRFATLNDAQIEKNKNCRFILRITTSDYYIQRLWNVANDKENGIQKDRIMGLFGRYDLMLNLTMSEFAAIFSDLCVSKIYGWFDATYPQQLNQDTFVKIISEGIRSGEIRIINERVMIPLLYDDDQCPDITGISGKHKKEAIANRRQNVMRQMNTITKKIKKFDDMEGLFVEERRAFIDIKREWTELIKTYVPQGMQQDSYINWKILVEDLDIVFKSIEDWKKQYNNDKDRKSQKKRRINFLEDMRLVIDAINQYYKFLQNVNAQTWQSPLYEIQTQLDAEKMMIAYREFLYEYFEQYTEIEDDSSKEGGKAIFYPLIYPNILEEIVSVMVAFSNNGKGRERLLICRVPSFEYYGRMFDMVPWIMHEASHSFRTLTRNERNSYLVYIAAKRGIIQALYEVLNKYTKDFGYYSLGETEENIAEIIADEIWKDFKQYCKKKNLKTEKMNIEQIETDLQQYLFLLLGTDISKRIYIKSESEEKCEEIKTALLHFLGELGLLTEKNITSVKECFEKEQELKQVIQVIYKEYCSQIGSKNLNEMGGEFLFIDGYEFERQLAKRMAIIQKSQESEIVRNYQFILRKLNRLCGAWRAARNILTESEVEWKNILCEEKIREIRNEIAKSYNKADGTIELYTILNMVFGYGSEVRDDDYKRIQECFAVFPEEIVKELVSREITIYRESCADIYMASSLKLSAFGYCRHMFQTAADSSVDEAIPWKDSVNIHRYRLVAAVLSGKISVDHTTSNKVVLSMERLFRDGYTYCQATIQCLCNRINETSYEDLVKELSADLKNEIDTIWNSLKDNSYIKSYLEESKLNVLINMLNKNKDFFTKEEENDDEIRSAKNLILKKYWPIKNTLKTYRHVLYRMQYFIYALCLLGENKSICVDKREYEHLKKIRDIYSEKSAKNPLNSTYKTVKKYYNSPESAEDKSAESMLEDTLQFIEEYYYKNRFKVIKRL